MLATRRASFARLAPLAAVATAIAAGTSTASADAITGVSDGYGVSASVHLLLLDLQVGPLAHSQGTAPSPYSHNSILANANASVVILGGLSTGVLSSTASSNVDGGSGSRFSTGTSLVDGLSLGILPGLPSLLTANATTIGSSATVSGDHGALAYAGSSTIEDLVIRVFGVNVAVNANAAPNSVIYNNLGIRIVLNEQLPGGNGFDSRSLTVNALHISFEDVIAGGGLLNGDIIVGHSYAAITTPTPGAAALLGAGGLMATRRRRR